MICTHAPHPTHTHARMPTHAHARTHAHTHTQCGGGGKKQGSIKPKEIISIITIVIQRVKTRLKHVSWQVNEDAKAPCGIPYLEMSSSDIFNFDSRIVQFWALLPSITDRILARIFPVCRRSSTEPSFCKATHTCMKFSIFGNVRYVCHTMLPFLRTYG
jgi:hypothetical protein